MATDVYTKVEHERRGYEPVLCQVGVWMTWFTDLRTFCTVHPLLMLAREAEAYHQHCQPTLKQKTTRLTRQAAYAGLGIERPPKTHGIHASQPKAQTCLHSGGAAR